MAKKPDKKKALISTNQTVAVNKRARFEYEILETYDAGIALVGTEVKSLRHGQANIAECYVGPKDGEIYIHNMHIPEYSQASGKLQHDPRRIRKLLLHKKEINKLLGSVTKQGLTIMPLKLYFDGRGLAKLEIGLAKGKKLHDKRETEKKRDWGREKQRLMREKG